MRNRPLAVMLFAAGYGTRMAPLTDRMPKPLIRVAGKALLDHALDVVREVETGTIVANTHYLADQMSAALAQRGIRPVHEPVILETGGGLRNALPLLGGGPVMTLNTDSVWTGPNPARMLRAAWDPDCMDAMLVLVPVADAVGHPGQGDFTLDGHGRLIRGPGFVYSGLQVLKTDRLHDIPEDVFSLNRVWDMMQAEGRLYGVVHKGGWCDVGRPENIVLAEAMLKDADV